MSYVVYLTIYSGNRLPPFYIGWTSEAKIQRGYNGSVKSKRFEKMWREERKTNRNLFKTIVLQKFETDKQAMDREGVIHRALNVVNNPLYINMTTGHTLFGGSGERSPRFGLPGPRRGQHHTDEAKQKIREAQTGVPNTVEQNRKISLSQMGDKNQFFGKHHTDETKQKIGKYPRGPRGPYKKYSKPNRPQEKLTCPHCGFTGSARNMRVYHFENCREYSSHTVYMRGYR